MITAEMTGSWVTLLQRCRPHSDEHSLYWDTLYDTDR